jgi:hypothetical protein
MVNANNDCWKITATPSATAEVCTSNPVHNPSVTNKPEPTPRNMDCVSTKILSGPGAIHSSSEAVRNNSKVSGLSMITSISTK